MKEEIFPANAPRPVGPYSPAIRANGFIFVSGQIGINPATGEIVRDSIQGQVRQVLENLKTVLESAGSSLEQVVKTTVFLADLNDFESMNAIYAEYFGSGKPARSTIQAAGLPKNVDVEIDVIALA